MKTEAGIGEALRAKRVKPNTLLPKNGKLCKPFERKIGGWVCQRFDAKVVIDGNTWLRVHMGMGGSGTREDWVADIPFFTASVHDYQFRPPYWGLEKYESFEIACRDQLSKEIESLRKKGDELRIQLNGITKALKQQSVKP